MRLPRIRFIYVLVVSAHFVWRNEEQSGFIDYHRIF